MLPPIPPWESPHHPPSLSYFLHFHSLKTTRYENCTCNWCNMGYMCWFITWLIFWLMGLLSWRWYQHWDYGNVIIWLSSVTLLRWNFQIGREFIKEKPCSTIGLLIVWLKWIVWIETLSFQLRTWWNGYLLSRFLTHFL